MSDPSPSGETWVCRAAKGYTRCDILPCTVRGYPEHKRCGPVPSSDTPSDERHPGYPHQPGEPLTLDLTVDLARPAPSTPVPEASGQSRDGQNQRLRALAVEAVIQEWLAEDISPCRYGAVEYDAECPWHMGEVDWPELARNIAAKLDASPAPSSSPVPEASGEDEVQPTP